MEPLRRIEGAAAPLTIPNIDTDVIIRIERLVALKRGAFGPYAFEAIRYAADGSEDPDFILNQDRYRHAVILVAGRNFGCGSSREAAVWALWDYGIRCIIAPGFGEIFQANCFQNGLLPIVLGQQLVDEIATAVRTGTDCSPLRVDLETSGITLPGGHVIPFEVDGRSREALLMGWDPIETTLADEPEIAAFQARDRLARPWVYDI